MNKKTLFLILLGVLVLPTIALAQILCPGGVNIPNMMCNAVNMVWIIATGIVIILWIVTGILFLTALGDPGKLKSAKTALLSSIAGTVLVIVAFSAMNLIGSALGIV